MKDRGLRIDEDVLGAVAVSIVKALRYLQETLRVIHRDVKPSNVLLSKDGLFTTNNFQLLFSIPSVSFQVKSNYVILVLAVS